MNSDTPRTDAEIRAVLSNGMGPLIVCHSFARQLEREINEAKAQLAASTIHTCHDNCQQPACQWRRVADELAAAIQIGNNHGYGLKIGEEALDAYNALKGKKT